MIILAQSCSEIEVHTLSCSCTLSLEACALSRAEFALTSNSLASMRPFSPRSFKIMRLSLLSLFLFDMSGFCLLSASANAPSVGKACNRTIFSMLIDQCHAGAVMQGIARFLCTHHRHNTSFCRMSRCGNACRIGMSSNRSCP